MWSSYVTEAHKRYTVLPQPSGFWINSTIQPFWAGHAPFGSYMQPIYFHLVMFEETGSCNMIIEYMFPSLNIIEMIISYFSLVGHLTFAKSLLILSKSCPGFVLLSCVLI